LCALTLALSLSGCWSGDVSDDSSGDFWEETPPVEADTSSTLTPITSFALPYLQGVTLDPITCPDGMQQTLGALLYEGLFVLDESFAPQNVLCSRYEHNDDCTSYTFYLRDGVSFSDGSILTASDVLATLRRAQESERYSARFANVASMRASNGALIVNLTRADSAFPALFDIPIVKSGSEKNTVPLGTGPYLFVTADDGVKLLRAGALDEIRAVLLERVVGILGIVARHGGGLDLRKLIGEAASRDAMVGEQLAHALRALGEDGEHQVLNGKILVVQLFGGLFGKVQDLADLGRGVHLAAAAGDAGQIADQRVELGE